MGWEVRLRPGLMTTKQDEWSHQRLARSGESGKDVVEPVQHPCLRTWPGAGGHKDLRQMDTSGHQTALLKSQPRAQSHTQESLERPRGLAWEKKQLGNIPALSW